MPFLFEDWSEPAAVVAKSSTGDVSLTRRTCRATRQHPVHPETFCLDLVSRPGSDEVWIGETPERYVVAGPKIWGLSRSMQLLRVRESEHTGGAVDGERVVIAKFLEKFLNDPRTELWRDPCPKTINLCRVFGWDAVFGANAYLPVELVEIIDAEADETGVTVSLKSTKTGQNTGQDFSITLSSDLDVLSASMDGKRVLVVRNALERSGALQEWSDPARTVVPSTQGKIAALLCDRVYARADGSGEQARAKALVLQSTGDVWIGPSDCRVAAVGERILGVTGRDGDLLLFAGPRTRIPLSQGSSQAFEAELVKFDNVFEANQCAWSPDAKKNLVELFQGDARFASAFEFGLRTVAAREDGVVLTLNSGTPGMHPEIVVGPNLDIVSVRVLTSAELRSR